jgi:hypothetical protein
MWQFALREKNESKEILFSLNICVCLSCHFYNVIIIITAAQTLQILQDMAKKWLTPLGWHSSLENVTFYSFYIE